MFWIVGSEYCDMVIETLFLFLFSSFSWYPNSWSDFMGVLHKLGIIGVSFEFLGIQKNIEFLFD